jgi:hypothetical protein
LNGEKKERERKENKNERLVHTDAFRSAQQHDKTAGGADTYRLIALRLDLT